MSRPQELQEPEIGSIGQGSQSQHKSRSVPRRKTHSHTQRSGSSIMTSLLLLWFWALQDLIVHVTAGRTRTNFNCKLLLYTVF